MKHINSATVLTSLFLQSSIVLSTPIDGVTADRRAPLYIPPGCELTCATFTLGCYGKYIGFGSKQKDVYDACQRSPECQSVMYEWDPYPSYYFNQPKSECIRDTLGGPYGYQSKFADDGWTRCPFIPDNYPGCQS